jgi:hypothetical protein
MDNKKISSENASTNISTRISSKKIAFILGGIALAWYVMSIFTIWHQ